ncbi:MAG: kelch repeat-containing protein [Cytophagales bacterium]|nr:kelch repeat-containing protein [Cytophagales bacterium]
MLLIAACNDEPIRVLVITSFSPESEGVGNLVSIEGCGFGVETGAMNVDFNGTLAEIISLNDSLLMVEIPSGATTGPISIQVSDQMIRSDQDFTVLEGTWTQKQGIPAEVGFGASVGFAFGGYGYVGAGGDNGRILDDFWKYDPSSDSWTDLPTIPNGARRFSSGFVIGNQVYVVLGVKDNETEITREFYAFGLLTNTWNRFNDFPGTLPDFRDTYPAFMIGNEGYLLLGEEIWHYDPGKDEWILVDTYPGAGTSSHVTEVIDKLAYIGLGFNDAFDWWSYDPETKEWKELAIFPGDLTWGLQSFQLRGKIYVVGKTCWEYDPITNQWIQRNSHPDGRRFATAFSIGEKGYFGTGISESGMSQFQKDFWDFSLE